MQHFFWAVEKLSTYNIAFKGLKEGNHVFDYHIADSFFEHFENRLVDHADVNVSITLEKRSSFMSVRLSLEGFVELTCDRCLELYHQPVQNEKQLWIKFGENESEDDDEVIWLHPEDYQINVAQIIYEYIILSVPLKHVHPSDKEGKSSCNPEMLKKLKEYTRHHEEQSDGRWEQLKDLLNNN